MNRWRDQRSGQPVPRLPRIEATVSELKSLGPAYYKKKLLIPAAKIWSGYSAGPKSAELRPNRAQACISLKWYHAALNDALHVLEPFSTSTLATKAAYRAARAEYGLSRYYEALGRFQVIGEDIARDWETKYRCRIGETDNGEYR